MELFVLKIHIPKREKLENKGKRIMYIEFSRMFAFVTSIVLVAGLYAQAYKIFKTKSAKDFTLTLLLALLVDEVAWMNYGITIREWPVYMLGITSLPAAIAAFVGYLKYGYRRKA